MSLGSEGVVLATDNRLTLTASKGGQPPISVNYDNATKLFSFPEPHDHVMIATYGTAVVGSSMEPRTAHSYLSELQSSLDDTRMSISKYAIAVQKFFTEKWDESEGTDDNSPMVFLVAGYDEEEPYGTVYEARVPNAADPKEWTFGAASFGATWGGQGQIASRIIGGYDPVIPEIISQILKPSDADLAKLVTAFQKNAQLTVPWGVLPLQDCIDMALFTIRATIQAQQLSIGIRGVGGGVDVAYVTRNKGVTFIQRQLLHGENQPDRR